MKRREFLKAGMLSLLAPSIGLSLLEKVHIGGVSEAIPVVGCSDVYPWKTWLESGSIGRYSNFTLYVDEEVK